MTSKLTHYFKKSHLFLNINKKNAAYYRIIELIKSDLKKDNSEVRILINREEHKIYLKENKVNIEKV